MFVAVGDRGFGLSHVRAWHHDPPSGELRVYVGPLTSAAGTDEGMIFHDEEAAMVVAVLRRHAAAASATLTAVEDLQRADDPVA